ncbi:MAG: hypothetical protein AVDCRST_MAG62-659 [uncultured Sphingomonas sp.]|uniref:Phosphatidic acid phosphatase type 2/haloperoxidase domain-containing protein n=1 Tax=uncultured Sphingomonas sp. TaxID=158754 RepID=A0A6J4T419_9SPHN|nr:MAG: hypothetical protein AVDCRST_MAG62-659 [uncultured Sphingomonas sp.]
MRRLSLLASVAALVAGPAQADTICEWMDFAQKIESASSPPPDAPPTPDHRPAQSQAALAMFEALNAIDRRYSSYLGMAPGDAFASQQAAAVTAAYQVLLTHYPAQKSQLESSYALAMDQVADPKARESGRQIGMQAAALALKAGLIDPSVAQTPYRPFAKPGTWVPTALPVFEPFAVAFKPWFMARADSFRPGPPPAMSSARYARDVGEVQRLGSTNSKERTAHQTLMARYRITPDMMPALRMQADQKGRRLVENARLFALYSMVADDAGMAMADAKLHYNYWRPITAIRNAADDGNPKTMSDPSWVPLIRTPNHPEYPCGHCLYAGATGELMKAVEGNQPAWGVRVASRSIPSAAIQVLPSWDKWVEEVSFSRTLGGVHYRFSNEVAEDMGRRIARLALSSAMKPLPPAEVRPAAD